MDASRVRVMWGALPPNVKLVTAPTEPFLQAQLAQTQWWPTAQLARHQFDQIRILVDHARRTIPYWSQRLDRAGMVPGAALDAQAWQQLPPLTRREVQRAGRELESDDVPETHGEFIETITSGSTGTPVRVVGTTLDAYYFKAFVLREHLWHKRDFKATMATIRKLHGEIGGYPQGVTAPRWGDRATFPFATGPAVALNISASIDEQVEWLQRHDPVYLATYPSVALALARTCLERRIRFPLLRQILTTGESVPDALRAECEEAFGVHIADMYSTMEVGTVAFQCPEHGNLHVQGEHCLVEIVDEDGLPCPPGEVGRVVVTPLHNFAMPLFRYDIGDFAEMGDPCACGRGLPVLRRVMGRVRNMLVAPDGQRYFPFFGATKFREIAPVVQSQFIQTSNDTVVARLIVERPLTQAEETALRERILFRLPCAVRIDFEYVDQIPRGSGGKYEEFISTV